MVIKTIIFSKDRACQLDMLIRSINKYYPECDYTVIYDYSNTDFKYGYDLIKNDRFILETDFKTNVLEAIEKEYTMFLCDDDVFLNRFSESDIIFKKFINFSEILTLSLRMSPQINYSFTQDKPLLNNSSIWHWKGLESYWGYPMSLDGHIFRTAEILPLLEKIEYKNPNELEMRLSENPIDLPLMLSCEKSIIVNIPLNRVQDTCKNRHLNKDQSELNESFLNGKRLDYVYPEKVNSCHQNIKTIWILV